jgi:hypothetical protein
MSDSLFDWDNAVQGSYPKELNSQNPLDTYEKCKLFSKKADAMYYTHTYDPTSMITKVRGELGLSEEVLSRFDSVRREGCCNVISITLYISKCVLNDLQKYLYSIHRSVKNVLKKLPGWIVRVYFDTSVEECVTKEGFDEFNAIFNAIKASPNVEVYTYDCPSFKKGASEEKSQIPIERTRTLRFLPLSDPQVNFCIVREADGIVSNLDCHNIKMYASNQDILFYLPQVITYTIRVRYDSYQIWLQLYKCMFARDYFEDHQNLKDLLAGTFCCKLKLKREYYQASVKSIQDEIKEFFSKTEKDQNDLVPNMQEIRDNYDDLEDILNLGFDELLLLKMYKELISLKIIWNGDTILWDRTRDNSKGIMDKMERMLIADNILMIEDTDNLNWNEFNALLKRIYSTLVSKEIISPFNIDALNDIKQESTVDILYYIDALLLRNIITKQPFNIKILSKSMRPERTKYVSQLVNEPYNPKFTDLHYDIDERVSSPSWFGATYNKMRGLFRGGRNQIRTRRFSRKIKKPSRHRRKLRMRKSRRNSRRY